MILPWNMAYRKRVQEVFANIDSEDDLTVLDSGRLFLCNPLVRRFLVYWTWGHTPICTAYHSWQRRQIDDPADHRDCQKGLRALMHYLKQQGAAEYWEYQNPGRHSYPYQELPDNHIRLLRILPGVKDAELESSLVTTLLDKSTRYETLSYAWAGARVRFVRCAQYQLKVTENLYQALRALRSETNERLFWIDAICIDQMNNDEKSKQLKLMGHIYAASEETTVWLSAVTKLLPEADKLMNALIRLGYDPAATVDLTHDRATWWHLAQLFGDPYFSRMWIIQEAAVSRDIFVKIQSQSWPWKDFIAAAVAARGHAKRFQIVFEPDNLIRLSEIRQMYVQKRFADILQVLLQTRRSASSLDNDKVYAALGMADNRFDAVIGEEASTTFVRFAAYVIERNVQKMLLLNLVTDRIYSLKRNLPSWVPDWEVRHGPRPFASWPVFSSWCAGGDSSSEMVLSNSNRSLHVRGFILDTIEYVGLPFREATSAWDSTANGTTQSGHVRLCISDIRSIRQAFRRSQQWYDIAMTHGHMYGGQTLRYHAFLLTLIASSAPSEPDGKFMVELAQGFRTWHSTAAWGLTDDQEFIQARAAQAGNTAISNGMKFIIENRNTAWGRRFFASQKMGMIGLCSSLVRRGDMVVVLHGGQTPYILRQVKNGKYKLLGECYAHGIMTGEALKTDKADVILSFELT